MGVPPGRIPGDKFRSQAIHRQDPDCRRFMRRNQSSNQVMKGILRAYEATTTVAEAVVLKTEKSNWLK